MIIIFLTMIFRDVIMLSVGRFYLYFLPHTEDKMMKNVGYIASYYYFYFYFTGSDSKVNLRCSSL